MDVRGPCGRSLLDPGPFSLPLFLSLKSIFLFLPLLCTSLAVAGEPFEGNTWTKNPFLYCNLFCFSESYYYFTLHREERKQAFRASTAPAPTFRRPFPTSNLFSGTKNPSNVPGAIQRGRSPVASSLAAAAAAGFTGAARDLSRHKNDAGRGSAAVS